MPESKKWMGPPVREKTPGDIERERIADEYDRRNKRGIYAECDDPDSPEYFLDEDERRELYAGREKNSQLDRATAAREAIYAKHSPLPEPEENPFDDRPAPQAAIEDFLARHPEISDKAWAEMNSPDFYLHAPDVAELQARIMASGSKEDMDKVLQRALDGYETFKTQQARKAAFDAIARDRFANRCKP